MRERRIAVGLSAACLVPMAVAAAALSLGGQSRVDGVVDDAASCAAAGARYVVEADECAFTSDVDVPQGRTLVLGPGIARFTFHRDLDVRGRLVAHSEVTTPADTVLAGHLDLQGPATLRVLGDDQSTRAAR